MTESEVKNCPKCGGTMSSGILSVKGSRGWEIQWRLKVRRGEKRLWLSDVEHVDIQNSTQQNCHKENNSYE